MGRPDGKPLTAETNETFSCMLTQSVPFSNTIYMCGCLWQTLLPPQGSYSLCPFTQCSGVQRQPLLYNCYSIGDEFQLKMRYNVITLRFTLTTWVILSNYQFQLDVCLVWDCELEESCFLRWTESQNKYPACVVKPNGYFVFQVCCCW